MTTWLAEASVTLVTTRAEAERVWHLYNAAREWMTRDTSEWTRQAFETWWQVAQAEPMAMWLFGTPEQPDTGFAWLSPEYLPPPEDDEPKLFITLGVAPEMRGQGLGTFIYGYVARHAEREWQQPTWAEIRADNPASWRAAERAGYRPKQQRRIADVWVLHYISRPC